MYKTITCNFIILLFYFNSSAQPDENTVLKTLRIGEYKVELIRYRLIEETLEIKMESAHRYGEQYVVYKNDSIVAQCPYIKGNCTIEFGEYKTINGFKYIDKGILLNICNYSVQKEEPAIIDWINDDVDSITIFPLDSVKQGPDGSPIQFIVNYADIKPQKLSEKQKQDVLFLYKDFRPISFTTSMPDVRNDFLLTFYTNGKAHTLIMYYDQFFYKHWGYMINYSTHSLYNVAQMIWDKHVETTGIRK